MRIIFKIASVLFSASVLLVAGGLWWAVSVFNAPGPKPQETFIVVERGETLGHIAARLAEEGLIGEPLLFKVAARIAGAEGDLKAGEYRVPQGASQKEILELLRSGKVFHRAVTIPEGRTSYEIVQILSRADFLEGEIQTIPAEGTLLPETYSYARGESRDKVIDRMQIAMSKTLEEMWPGRVEGLPFSTVEEALTLASIVEKETGVAEERATVAGVFINRLRKGMPLQTDPTVIYALTGGEHKSEGKGPLGRRLLRKDLDFDSPYNTYKYAGLPPGPIANPGRDAIAAVLNPANHDFLYFVADGKGGHAFAKTLEEHNRNVTLWRNIRKSSR